MKIEMKKGIGEAIFHKIAPFVATAILSVGIKVLFDWWKESVEKDTGATASSAFIPFVLGAMLVAVALSISTLGFVIWSWVRDIRDSQAYRVTLQKSIEGLERPTAFDYCAAIARQAKESITIISPHFMPDNASPSHDEYLREGLDRAILVAVERSNSSFRYRRIVQLDQSAAGQVDADGVIDAAVIGNSALADHINRSIIRNAQSQSIDVKIYCRTFVPSLRASW